MASTGQIIPKYLHPHQELYINDNTVRREVTVQRPIQFKSLHVFVSNKGRDNVFLNQTSYVDYLNEYGIPVIENGQAAYMPYVALKAGFSSTQCMRIMPLDAKYANAVLFARVKYNDVPTPVVAANPSYNPDETINPPKILNPEYQELYIPNPYKDMTVPEVIDAIGHDELMPNNDFNPTLPISAENPLGITNIYRIIDAGFVGIDEDQIIDGNGEEDSNPIYDGGDGTEKNIFKDILYIVNLDYDPTIDKYIDNPAYEPPTITMMIPADNKVHVSLSIKNMEIKNIDDIPMMLEYMVPDYEDDEPDEEGYYEYPLFAFHSLGRGEYGNDIVISVLQDFVSNKNNEFFNYVFKISASDRTSTDVISRACSSPDALYKNLSLFIEDVINDPDRGSELIGCVASLKGIEQFKKFISVKAGVKIDDNTFDIFFGQNKDYKSLEGIIYEKIRVNDIDFETDSFVLANGDDGSFSKDNPNRDQAIADAYVKAFTGKINRAIFSKKRTPANFIFDANYPDEAKEALKALIVSDYRGDMQGYLDGGILNTQEELEAWLSEQTDGHFLYSKDPFNFKVRDPFNSKIITVTATYFIASNLAKHVELNELNTPFARKKYAKVTGIVKNSLRPLVDPIDFDVKEKLYTSGVNYYEPLSDDEFMRSTQITSQQVISDLSMESNVRVLVTLISRLEELNDDIIYNFAEEEDRQLYTNAGRRMLEEYQKMYREADVKFEATEYEQEYNILHCYLYVIFKNIAERIIAEVDINPRV